MKTAQKLNDYFKLKPTGSKFVYLTKNKPAFQACDLSKATEATEQAFHFLNEALFDGKIEPVVITLQSSKGSYGHCTVNKIWDDGTQNHSKREINLSVDYLSIDPFHFLGTLIHEMVHSRNLDLGVRDCDSSTQYHNKNFKTLAESVGLIVTKMGNYGFAHTQVAMNNLDGIEPVAEQAIAELILKPFWNRSDFDFQRGGKMGFNPSDGLGPIGPRGGKGSATGKGSGKMKKWVCQCLNRQGKRQAIRVAISHFDATCNICETVFEKV